MNFFCRQYREEKFRRIFSTNSGEKKSDAPRNLPAELQGTFADHKSLPRSCGGLLQTTKVSRGTAGDFCRPRKSPAELRGTFADHKSLPRNCGRLLQTEFNTTGCSNEIRFMR
jgi:hypothetical protein